MQSEHTDKTFFITTAIDYTNGSPHIGHAYEKVLADAISRYLRLFGRKVYFLTGVDQHGQKVQQTAEAQGTSPAAYVGETTEKFIALWNRLEVKYDGWAATTDPRHKRVVRAMLQRLHDEGQIYKKATRGFYSVRQEQFLTDRDRDQDGKFGEEWGTVEEREEENYYFRLSHHIEWLAAFLESHPDAVFPDSRMAHLRKAVEDGRDADLCISRPKSRLTWGIELPFDPDYVTYVWFDALTNYISFAGYLAEEGSGLPNFKELWPCDAHVIGKDILTPPHGIYWMAMLHALGFTDAEMPKILVHGWWNVRGEKMSKTLGNVVDPHVLADAFGVDGTRYYLLSEIATGADSDLSEERMAVRYNKELGNMLGNLLNRTLNMASKYHAGVVVKSSFEDELSRELRAAVVALPARVKEAVLNGWQVQRALASVWEVVALANTYIEKTQPFKLKGPENEDQLACVMSHLLETLAHISVHISPVMPGAALKMQEQLQWTPPEGLLLHELVWGLLPAGHAVGKGEPIFPRFEANPA